MAAGLSLCWLIAVLASGCSSPAVLESLPSEPDYRLSLDQLDGRLLTDEPLLVLPNRAWRRHADRDAWFMARAASMICQLNEPLTQQLSFGFLLEEGAERPCLEVSWNGQEVSDRTRWEDRELRVVFEPGELEPGTHLLSLQQCAAQALLPAVTFQHIGYRRPDSVHILPGEKFEDFLFLADLLTFGVTGSFGREKLGGMVFQGLHTVAVELPADGGGQLSLRLQNASFGPATFRAQAGDRLTEIEIGPHQREVLQVEVPADSSEILLDIAGDPNGFYLWGAPTFVPAGGETLPSLILITLDTTRRDVLGAYGGPPGLTPTLDALAAGATVFERAYSPSSWTLPSHASIFTGLYPSRHGAGVAGDHLEGRFATLAELLRQRGYLTAGFAGGMLSSYRFGIAQGFSLFRDPTGFESTADEINSHAQQLLESSTEQPLFLFVNYFDPHFPYAAPRGFRKAFEVDEKIARVETPELWRQALDGSSEAWLRVTAGEVEHTPEALDALGAAYRAEVAFTDQQLGRLFDDLRRNNRWDDSLIVVTADHGELLGEGGYVSHAARLDPELVEIPLIVKWPGQRQAERRDHLVSLVDLFPTLLQTAGIEPPVDIDGISLQAEEALESRREVWMEEHDSDFHGLPEQMRHGADAYGRQSKAFRQIAWEDGGFCARGGAGAWRPASCPADDPDGRKLFDNAGADAWRAQATRIGLSDEERASLRALGYLQ